MLDFTLPSNTGSDFQLTEAPIVLFFYPRDNTPGCTIENQDFATHHQDFINLGYTVYGISRDKISSHCNFSAKYNLPFPLLSDVDETVCNIFKVMKDKKMYGKDVRGIERSTFIIKNKQIVHEWRKVNVDGHVAEVLKYIKNL